MNEFEFCSSSIDGVRVCAPVGEIDLATAPDLDLALRTELARDPPAVIIRLDLVTFLDSTGISALVSAHRHAHQRGTFLALAAPSAPVRKVFEITSLGKAITVHATLRTALAEAGSTPTGLPPQACPDHNPGQSAHGTGSTT